MPVDKATKARNKEKYGDEQVFVIPFPAVAGLQDKFTRVEHTKEIWTKYDTAGKYIFRYDAEGEPAFQQLIPYILVTNSAMDKFYVSRRLSASGEERLHGQTSMGFGGHINPCDGVYEVLFHAMMRELHEELYIEPVSAAKFVGHVRDMTSTTNDHLGCVFIVQANDGVCIKETESHAGEWMELKQLEDRYFEFESWSKHIIDYLVSHQYKF